MLRRVKIKGYKSLVDFEVQAKPLMIIFGANASGKSNFFDALQLLSRIVSAKTLKDAFEPPYRGRPLESFTFGPRGVIDHVGKQRVSFSMEVDVELSPAVIREVESEIRMMKRRAEGGKQPGKNDCAISETYLRYRIKVAMSPKSGTLNLAEEYMVPLNPQGNPRRKVAPLLFEEGYMSFNVEGEPFFLAPHLERNQSILSLPLYPPNHPHLYAFKKELENWFFYSFEPRQRMRANYPVSDVRHLGLMGEDLAPYLNTLRINAPAEFEAFEQALHRIIPSIDGVELSVDNLGEVELRIKEGQALIPARVASEGTLRVLGLLALSGVKQSPALIGLEEPSDGIDPQSFSLIADHLNKMTQGGETQMIVNTYSPQLLSFTPADSLYSCEKKNGMTVISPYERAER